MNLLQRIIQWLTGLFMGRAARAALQAGNAQANAAVRQANQMGQQWASGQMPYQQGQTQQPQQGYPQQGYPQQGYGQSPQQGYAPPAPQASGAPGPQAPAALGPGPSESVSEDEWNQYAARQRNTFEVAPERWQDDWGPLRNDQVEDFFLHHFEIEAAGNEPAKKQQTARRLGYQDYWHYERVRVTFLKYYGTRHGSNVDDATWQDPRVTQAMLNARQRQTQASMAATAAANPEMLAPIEGVTLEQYAAIAAQQARGLGQAEFQQLLAQHGMDQAKFERVSGGWMQRMSRDTTATIATIYGKAFSSSGAGAYGASGQAGGAAMAGVSGPVGQAPAGGPQVTLEQYAEIMGAQSAWAAQGKDVNAMLKQKFNMSALDYSNVSSYWSAKMMADYTLMNQLMTLQQKYEQKYRAPDADSDLRF